MERRTLRRERNAVTRDLPSQQGALPTGRSVNQLRQAVAELDQIQGGHRTTRGRLQLTPRRMPNPPPPETIVINGKRLTIAGTPNRFIKAQCDGSAAEWSATEVSPWPTDGSVFYIDTWRNEPIIIL